jgi:hypothetical protein
MNGQQPFGEANFARLENRTNGHGELLTAVGALHETRTVGFSCKGVMAVYNAAMRAHTAPSGQRSFSRYSLALLSSVKWGALKVCMTISPMIHTGTLGKWVCQVYNHGLIVNNCQLQSISHKPNLTRRSDFAGIGFRISIPCWGLYADVVSKKGLVLMYLNRRRR